MMTEKMYCGIDISSEKLDLCFQTLEGQKEHLEVANNKKGFAQILEKYSAVNYHFVMESTGVYHMELMFYLHNKKAVYSIVNALQIRRYIQMHLERNKSDKKDAKRICEYGIERKPPATQMPDNAYFECRSLNNSIHDLTKDITKWTNQIHALKRSGVNVSEVVKSYEKIIEKITHEKDRLSALLQSKLQSWQPKLWQQVSSVKGIGKCAASELVIYT